MNTDEILNTPLKKRNYDSPYAISKPIAMRIENHPLLCNFETRNYDGFELQTIRQIQDYLDSGCIKSLDIAIRKTSKNVMPELDETQ